MKAKSIWGNNLRRIETAYNQVLADNYKPTLAIVFMSVKQNIDGVSHFLNKNDVVIFGATTNGEFDKQCRCRSALNQ